MRRASTCDRAIGIRGKEPDRPARRGLIGAIAWIALGTGIGTATVAGCGHPDAGSIDLTAAKQAAAGSGRKMIEPGSLKGRGRGRAPGQSRASDEAPRLAPSGRAAPRH
ncbi:hypothetical protein [Aquisphaera insulae]|uniref:hypothetical protein n=1 Tax=Aquisphaera insulae TaxID=2712864 RepID=UPI0013EC3BFB|nr:hypothetical protein [Aquisphaera insulae]